MKEKKVATGLLLDKEMADEIDRLARIDERSRLSFITRMLREQLKQLKAEKAS